MNNTIQCPECSKRLAPDFVRCPFCHAYVVDPSPWRNEFSLYTIPLALFLWWGLDRVLRLEGLFTANIFADPISRAILGLAIYGITMLIFKGRVTARQTRAFLLVRQVLTENDSRVDDDILETTRQRLVAVGAYNKFLAFQRLRWLAAAAAADKDVRPGLVETLRQHSEADQDSLESALATAQFLIWLLPTAGFLGTVWGMMQALKSFSGVVGSTSNLDFSAGLVNTAQGLGVAFHTTLVGLALVIPVLALATICRRRAQFFLERLDKYFLRLGTQTLYGLDELPAIAAAPPPLAETPAAGPAPPPEPAPTPEPLPAAPLAAEANPPEDTRDVSPEATV